MRRATLQALGLAAVFAFGLALVLVYGREGYMPLDQSIVFDGGWRTLCGQVPYRDYVAPNAILPSWLQAGFFALFGVSWFAYVLHAAVANGVLGCLTYALLRGFEAQRGLALVYALLSTIFFYPPFGVPYMEQHAFLFSLVAVVLAVWAGRAPAGSKREVGAWIAVPFALVAALLSKQIPSGFAVPLVVAIAFAQPRARWLRAFVCLLGGALLAVGMLCVWAWWAGVEVQTFATYYLRLPSEEGALKRHWLRTPERVANKVWNTASASNLLTLEAAPALALVIGVVTALRARVEGAARRALAATALAFGLLVVSYAFVLLTGNQWQNGVAWLIPAVGLLHTALESEARAGDLRTSGRSAVAFRLCGALLVAAAVRDAWVFHRDVNRTRVVNDITFDAAVADGARAGLPPELAFMRWNVPQHYRTEPAELAALARRLAAEEHGFLLLGDMTVLYALARKPSLAPPLWWHKALTLPDPEDPAWDDFESRLVAPFLSGAARYLVLEGEGTWSQRTLADFPRLSQLVDERKLDEHTFGFFRVLDLGPR